MKDLIKNFPVQLAESLEISKKSTISDPDFSPKNVLICGLGGSGIAASIIVDLSISQSNVPIIVSKEYNVPAFVNENTLVIVSSYSGNTEETVESFQQAYKRNAKIVCVTSGGKIAELAKQNQLDLITIPGGMPPRACLGYSLIQLLHIFNLFGIAKFDISREINQSISLLKSEKDDIINKAKEITENLHDKFPVLYSCSGLEGVAVRFKQQLNENSKMLAMQHVIPEMNHNEILGWRKKSDQWSVLFIHNKEEHPQNQKRLQISEKVISKYCSSFSHVYPKGNSPIEVMLYLIHLLDWASVFLAEKKHQDPVEIEVINYLKSELAK